MGGTYAPHASALSALDSLDSRDVLAQEKRVVPSGRQLLFARKKSQRSVPSAVPAAPSTRVLNLLETACTCLC